MATVESNKLEIDQLKTQLAEILSKSVEPKDGDATAVLNNSALVPVQNPGENVKFITALEFLFLMLKQIGMMEINATGDKTNTYCFGKKAGINDGNLIIGWKSTVANPTSDSDFETPYGYSQ